MFSDMCRLVFDFVGVRFGCTWVRIQFGLGAFPFSFRSASGRFGFGLASGRFVFGSSRFPLSVFQSSGHDILTIWT